jgi:hypothetical protein
MLKYNHVRDHLTLGIRIDELEAAVGIQWRTNVEPILCEKVPRAMGG